MLCLLALKQVLQVDKFSSLLRKEINFVFCLILRTSTVDINSLNKDKVHAIFDGYLPRMGIVSGKFITLIMKNSTSFNKRSIQIFSIFTVVHEFVPCFPFILCSC